VEQLPALQIQTVRIDPALAPGRTSRIKPGDVGTGLKLDRISHVDNLQVVTFYELELLAKLLVPDRAFGSFPQQADHFGNAHVRRRTAKLFEFKSALCQQSTVHDHRNSRAMRHNLEIACDFRNADTGFPCPGVAT
jgi:hypothetical protein